MSSPTPELEPHPIFNTTFALHSLTPLYSFPSLTATALRPHSKRLLRVLRGENVRGVALHPGEPSNAGKVLSCTWGPLPSYSDEDRDTTIGVRIDVECENATYTALLIGDDTPAQEGFTRLPLLMSRLPAAMRAQLIEYLAITFDTLALPLLLPSVLLRKCLDDYITEVEGSGGKDVELTFAGKAEGLKAITITVTAEDADRFWERASGSDGKGFLDVLGEHLEYAMGLRVADMEIAKVATGGFVLAEGKGKFFEEKGIPTLKTVLQKAGNQPSR